MNTEAEMNAEPEDEYAEGVLPPVPEVAEKTTRGLQAWHRPRKQLVRNGWRENVRRLMKEMRLPQGEQRTLRYFTLPAPEMLDIRVLEESAREKQFQIQYVGMTNARNGSEDDRQLQLGQAMLKAQPEWIHSASTMLYYKLEDLATGTKPVAHQKLSEYAPFHVVNLDLCDYLLAPGENARVFDALERIIEMQTIRPRGDWLLFIATRFGAAQTCPTKFQHLNDAIEKNCASSPEFQSGLEQLLGVPEGKANPLLKDPSQLSQSHLRDAISVGLTKWLASKLLQANPPFELDMMTTYVYAVDGKEHDMLSLVYRCRYRGNAAPVGEVAAVEDADTIERRVALRALKKTQGLVDLDAEMRDNPKALQELAEQTKILLKEANYSDAVLAGYKAFEDEAIQQPKAA